jgi:hypothetical protein
MGRFCVKQGTVQFFCCCDIPFFCNAVCYLRTYSSVFYYASYCKQFSLQRFQVHSVFSNRIIQPSGKGIYGRTGEKIKRRPHKHLTVQQSGKSHRFFKSTIIKYDYIVVNYANFLGGVGDGASSNSFSSHWIFGSTTQPVRLAGGWCYFVLRKKYWWLVCSKRKVLLVGGW